MSNELVKQKNWLQRSWKWMLPLVVVCFLTFTLFLSMTAGHLGDFGKAYAEPHLYQGAVEIAQKNKEVTALLGKLEPVGKIAILEGDIDYSDDNSHVELSVRVVGATGKATMYAIANRINNVWEYKEITIQIKNPPENRQKIKVR